MSGIDNIEYRFTIEGKFLIDKHKVPFIRVSDLGNMLERRLAEHIPADALTTAKCTRVDVKTTEKVTGHNIDPGFLSTIPIPRPSKMECVACCKEAVVNWAGVQSYPMCRDHYVMGLNMGFKHDDEGSEHRRIWVEQLIDFKRFSKD